MRPCTELPRTRGMVLSETHRTNYDIFTVMGEASGISNLLILIYYHHCEVTLEVSLNMRSMRTMVKDVLFLDRAFFS